MRAAECGGLVACRNACVCVQQLREAPVTFLPTYKKADARPPLDITDRDWVLKEYQVTMKKGVLGQKKVVERPPSVGLLLIEAL